MALLVDWRIVISMGVAVDMMTKRPGAGYCRNRIASKRSHHGSVCKHSDSTCLGSLGREGRAITANSLQATCSTNVYTSSYYKLS